jgi:hypothetical protein
MEQACIAASCLLRNAAHVAEITYTNVEAALLLRTIDCDTAPAVISHRKGRPPVSIIDSLLSLANWTGLAALVTVMALSFHPPLGTMRVSIQRLTVHRHS